MADGMRIDEAMRGLWPKSQKLTQALLAEIIRAFEDLTDEQFDEALAKHRQSEQSHFVPDGRTLRGYVAGTPQDPGLYRNHWAAALMRFGEEEARERLASFNLGYPVPFHEKLQAWVATDGELPDWYGQFLNLLHAGEIVEAHEFAAENTEGVNRERYRDGAVWYGKLGPEQARRCFPYFGHRKAREHAPFVPGSKPMLKNTKDILKPAKSPGQAVAELAADELTKSDKNARDGSWLN